MNTNHAKAIKGMSIANIVLAALGIFGMLIAWAGLGVGSPIPSGFDYFYGLCSPPMTCQCCSACWASSSSS
ncbi:MAG: hypothetical protein ACLUE1_03695 [Adlercreutzia equolifaciens]